MPPAPSHEPLKATLARNCTIAVIIGAILAWRAHSLSTWPVASLIVLWPTLGGHYVELIYLTRLRPRIPNSAPIQSLTRLTVWFAGGCVLYLAMIVTASILRPQPTTWPPIWKGGLAFIAIELLVHLPLFLRSKPNFYNPQG